jgi:hypothetical protein
MGSLIEGTDVRLIQRLKHRKGERPCGTGQSLSMGGGFANRFCIGYEKLREEHGTSLFVCLLEFV